jgi:hypothetical protein
MAFPIEITFRGMEPSDALEATIRACAAKLDHVEHRISACDVVVEVPHRHKRHGRHVRVRVVLSLPGHEIVVSRAWDRDDSDGDAHVTTRDVFDTARRLLIERATRARAVVRPADAGPRSS